MPSPKLIAVITALVFVASAQGGHAAFTFAQLQEIEKLILSKDCGALWFYLQDNPEILEGDDPLADELRKFALGIESGLIDCIFAPPGGVGQNFSTVIVPTY